MNLFKSDKKIHKKFQSNVLKVGKRSIATLFAKNIIIVVIGITVVLGCNTDYLIRPIANDDNLQSEIDVLKTQINTLSGSDSNLQTQINVLSGSSGMTITDLQNIITSLQTYINSLTGGNPIIVPNNNDTAAIITRLQNYLLQLQSQLSALSGNNSTIQTQLFQLQSHLSALSGNNSALQTQLSQLQSQLSTLSGNNSILQTQLNSLSGENAVNIAALQTQINALSGAGNLQPSSEMVYIHDDTFRRAIITCINTNGETTLNGQISSNFECAENYDGSIIADDNLIEIAVLQAITRFSYRGGGISALIGYISDGLKQMVNLTHLNVNTNSLNSLDVSNNTALINLNVNNNRLTNLDLSGNTLLTFLELNYNNLTSLDVSNATALSSLSVSNNYRLMTLDVSANTALTNLDISRNGFGSFDVSNNTELTRLDVRFNSLSCIKVSASQLSGGANFIPPYDSNTDTGLWNDSSYTLSGSCL